MADRYGMSLVTDAADWEELFSRVEHPHMVQSWAFGDAKQAAGGWRVRRLVFESGGDPVAICQVLDKSLAGIRCASRLYRGPLFLGADPQEEVVRGVYRALRHHWRHLRGVLVLAPALTACPENCGMLAELGFRRRRKPGYRSARVDLRLSEEELFGNLASTWRNRLRAAERSDLTMKVLQSPEDVQWIIARHVENMRDKGFAGPSPALVRALYEAAPDDFFVFQARLGDAAVGAMAVYRFGQGAEYYVGWSGPEGRKVSVSNFLYWEIGLELQRRGCLWFDLGGCRANKKYGHFKRGMRGVDYELIDEWLAV